MNRTITVVSYNICHGRFADFDWERIASPIRALDPDLVGIQEVDMFHPPLPRHQYPAGVGRGYGTSACLLCPHHGLRCRPIRHRHPLPLSH